MKYLFLAALFLFALPLGASAQICVGGEDEFGNPCTTSAPTTQTTQTQTSSGGGFVPLAPIPGLTEGATADSQGMANFFNNLYIFLVGFAAAAAVVEIIIGGVQYATTGNISKKTDGKTRIQQAILGLVLILMPALVFGIINPKILNLSIGWDPVKVAPPGTTPGTLGGLSGSNIPTPTTGCTTAPGGQYLERAVCANYAAATAYTCKNTAFHLLVPACTQLNPNGTCAQTSAIAYCVGKSETLLYYAYWHTAAGLLDPFVAIIPHDAQAETAFEQGCSSDGGETVKTNTSAAAAFLLSHAYQVSSGCPSDSGVILDTTKGAGVACWSKELTCNIPS